MSALVTVLVLLGWLAVVFGVVVLVWDFIVNRVLSRTGLAAVFAGAVLIVLASVLPFGYDTAALL